MIEHYENAILAYAKKNYRKMFREPEGQLKYPFIVPGSCYKNTLWDWDSWLTDIALDKIAEGEDIFEYEKGCILNFLDHMDEEGRIPIVIKPGSGKLDLIPGQETNIHKPVLAQHALFVVQKHQDAEWLLPNYEKIERYLDYYTNHYLHKETGLYVWIDDCAIGVDNDPCTFYRPKRSSASILLNCFLYKEFLAAKEIAEYLDLKESAEKFKMQANALKNAIQEECWDEKDGFFYSVDVNLLPIRNDVYLHSGCPRDWHGLIQRIGVWSGFLAMWSGIATPEQAERMVKENYLDTRTFCAPYGVRTLSKMEKMYKVIKSGNPSCWLGPIWGVSNYMVFEALKQYGYIAEAKELCKKTIELFGKDILVNGEMHEYYHPETGEGVNNPGFQNWNLLSVNMIEWLHQCE